tara:strand:- start:644 stop:751 length:108 start_codon:yes stop_codon:yes gene_type:complete
MCRVADMARMMVQRAEKAQLMKIKEAGDISVATNR